MSHIHGHIGIEESYMFPAFQAHYKNLDSSFLLADHEKLDGLETAIGNKFQEVRLELKSESVVQLLEQFLDYDTVLMQHLGEEEEWVVSLDLTAPHKLA